MAGSTLSLDSLSSPSPSPSPPPETAKPTEPTSAGLDSDSELSELTEEEQVTDKRDKSPRKGLRNGTSRRGRHPSRRGGRRKTSSIVPAPMWGWAETKASSNAVEEEEEEEIAGPPRAMEEEEDEETRGGEDDEESSASKNPDGEDDPVEEEHSTVANGIDDDDGFISGDEGSSYRTVRPRRSTRKLSGVPATSADSEDEADNNGIVVNGDGDEIDVEGGEGDGGDVSDLPPEPESENETESEAEPDTKDTDAATTNGEDTLILPPKFATSPQMTVLMDVDVDVTAPLPEDIAPLAAAAAASSIMAGSGLINPPSPSSSRASSVSGSAASSRSSSPAPGSDTEEALADTKSHDTKANALPSHDASATHVSMEVDVTDGNTAREREREPEDQGAEDELDLEVESDLQPAHRAEALDVLATIELKFALLRERLYVEKMEGLAWEETLVSEGTHPELLHLHRELSSRRDKRLELATRKRAYETNNITKRRRADEDAIWSWWKLARDELQTDMISETNRKRRRMERERRAIERPHPVRRIPSLPQDLPPAPPLRKIIKSIPFGPARQTRHHAHSQQKLVYPELSTLSGADVANDLDFLFQARMERDRGRVPMGYDPHMHRGVAGSLPNSSYMGMGLPPASHPLGYDAYNDNSIGVGGPGSFSGGANANHRIQPPPFQQHQQQQHYHHHSLPPQQPQQYNGPSMMSLDPFAGPPGSRNVHMQSQHNPPPPPLHNHSHGHSHTHAPPPPHHSHGQSQFVLEQQQEISGGGSGVIASGPGGPMLPHHAYVGPQPGGGLRRSPSPPSVLPNGAGGGSGKVNGNWMGAGMGMGGVYNGKVSDWGGRVVTEDEERAAKERDKRDREKDREREQRERERDREREREREREHTRDREHQEIERERKRDLHHIHQHQHQQQQMQHRHPPSLPHLHLHPVTPSGGQTPHHHINTPHHHHRPHHHHVLHHHHQSQSGAPTSHPPPSMLPQGPLHSPRSTQQREYDNNSRSLTTHTQHQTEVINLNSSKSASSSAHSHWKGEEQQHTPLDYRDIRNKHGGGGGRPPAPVMDDRDRPPAIPFAMSSSHAMSSNMSPPNHGPPPPINGTSSPRSVWNTAEDNNFRLPAPSALTSSASTGGPPGYPGTSHDGGHTRSPNHRYANSSSGGGSLGRGPPPSSSQQPSRQNSLGLLSPPRPTANRPLLPPASPSAPSSVAYSNSNRSPTRFGPPPPPPSQGSQPPSSSTTATSLPPVPPINLKMRPPSPLASKMLPGPLPLPPPSSVSVYSPRLSGPGRTSTPLGEGLGTKNGVGPGFSAGGNTRTASPLLAFPSPGSNTSLSTSMGARSLLNSSSMNGNTTGLSVGGDRDREREWSDRERDRDRDREREREHERDRDRHSPTHLGPPPSKMSVPQMVDGH